MAGRKPRRVEVLLVPDELQRRKYPHRISSLDVFLLLHGHPSHPAGRSAHMALPPQNLLMWLKDENPNKVMLSRSSPAAPLHQQADLCSHMELYFFILESSGVMLYL